MESPCLIYPQFNIYLSKLFSILHRFIRIVFIHTILTNIKSIIIIGSVRFLTDGSEYITRPPPYIIIWFIWYFNISVYFFNFYRFYFNFWNKNFILNLMNIWFRERTLFFYLIPHLMIDSNFDRNIYIYIYIYI